MVEVCLCGHTRKSHVSQTEECRVCESCPEFVSADPEEMYAPATSHTAADDKGGN